MQNYSKYFVSKMNVNLLFHFISTYVVPLGIILYLNFDTVAPAIMLHNIAIACIGGIDIYVRQLKNRQPQQQLEMLGMSKNTTNAVCFLIHALLIAAVVYKPIDPLRIPIESHFILILVAIVIFGLPWWPYSITRNEMFVSYIVMYMGMFIGSIILDKKLLN